MTEQPDIERLIEASSLGTPAAKAARDSVSEADAQRIVDRVNQVPNTSDDILTAASQWQVAYINRSDTCYREASHLLAQLAAEVERLRALAIEPPAQCGDVNGPYVCSLVPGHERSHQAQDWIGLMSWGGWQGCLCKVPNTQATRCPKHGNALPAAAEAEEPR